MTESDDLDQKVDFKNLKISMDIPKGHLFIIILLLFLVAGFTIGYLIGGHNVETQWQEYHEYYEQYVDSSCICIEPEQKQFGGLEWDSEKSLT